MKRTLLLFAATTLPFLGMATVDPCLPTRPADENHLVFQLTPLLDAREAELLDGKLVRFAQETSNRIAVLVVDTLCGYPASDFAFEVGQAWGIGGKKTENGVLILIKPTGPPGQRDVFIATGYGLEGAIPDLTCKRIVENEIIPRFREGQFYEGLDQATDVLMGLAKGEFNAESYGSGNAKDMVGGLFVVLIVIIVFIAAFFIQRGRVRDYARRNNIDLWSAWWLMNQASRSHNGRWGGFTGGGGGWGGGGGGFGGFGGGGFGGGGAGGKW